ncbi:hypothetical protein FA13DRAFT_654746 [Coprinellus micaceus]|uniref:Uncharacterized protein n=1 Tax=Coprinellus micaceus TaxID=71717 RepID=A0A4Y7SA19_COPMI|nr:hypothetical protein FA13DRAFT_654746 [Coprinellus micaceus]
MASVFMNSLTANPRHRILCCAPLPRAHCSCIQLHLYATDRSSIESIHVTHNVPYDDRTNLEKVRKSGRSPFISTHQRPKPSASTASPLPRSRRSAQPFHRVHIVSTWSRPPRQGFAGMVDRVTRAESQAILGALIPPTPKMQGGGGGRGGERRDGELE